MGSVNTFTASGQGSLSLGGQHNVTEIVSKIITPADLATFFGASPIRRVHRQGWYGLGFTPSVGPIAFTTLITFSTYVKFEAEDYFPALGVYQVADTLYWDINPGGVMYFEIDW